MPVVPSYSKFDTFCEENNLPPEKVTELKQIASAIVREEYQRAYKNMKKEIDDGLAAKAKRLKNL